MPNFKHKTLGLVLCLSLFSISQQAAASIVFSCVADVVSIADTTAPDRGGDSDAKRDDSHGLWSAESCNKDVTFSVASNFEWGAASSQASLKSSLNKFGESYVFHAEGSVAISAYGDARVIDMFGGFGYPTDESSAWARSTLGMQWTADTAYAVDITASSETTLPVKPQQYYGGTGGVFVNDGSGFYLVSNTSFTSSNIFNPGGVLTGGHLFGDISVDTRVSGNFIGDIPVSESDHGNSFFNFTVVFTPLTPVPLPSSLWLFITGSLVGSGFRLLKLRRAKRK